MVRSQNLHNKILKVWTNTKILKKSIDFFLLLTIIEYERSKKVKDKNKKKMQISISINKYLNVWIFKKHKNEKTYKKPIKSIVHL